MKKPLLLSLCIICIYIGTNAQIINTVAGNGTQGYSGDGGPATAAQLYNPGALATDTSGNIYVADYNNSAIREISSTTGFITTIAGNGTAGYSGDGGQATAAKLNMATSVALDSLGNIYIADYSNNRIRKISKATGIITTIVGTGVAGYSGDGGQATAAKIDQPEDIAFDRLGNLYVSDAENCRIRKINMTSGIINTIAGNGTAGYSGDGGQATAAKLFYPTGLSVDDSNNIFIADFYNNCIRKVSKASGIITTIAGNGTLGYSGDGGPATAATMHYPMNIKFDKSQNLFIADANNNCVREVFAATRIITTIAGTSSVGYTGDGGPATAAKMYYPDGLVFNKTGVLYIADAGNDVIRDITGLTGLDQLSLSLYNISVYPNPSNGVFAIEIKNEEFRIKSVVEVYNMLGEMVYTAPLNPSVMGTSVTTISLPNGEGQGGATTGIYLYRVLSETGSLIGEGKLVIQH